MEQASLLPALPIALRPEICVASPALACNGSGLSPYSEQATGGDWATAQVMLEDPGVSAKKSMGHESVGDSEGRL